MKLALVVEMAREAKICPKCGKKITGNHYWYKGEWRCKKSSEPTADSKEEQKPAAVAEDPVNKAEAEAVAEEPTYVMKDTADVAQHLYPVLQEKIEKINKRARKNKLPEIKLEIIKEFMKEVKKSDPDDIYGEVDKVQIPYYTVKVSGDPPKIAGYKFIATIEHQEGGNIIRTVPGEEGSAQIKKFYEAKPHYCDHCKKIRRRIDTFIVKEEKTGKLRQIGRNCLADFLGGADPKAILWYFDNRDNLTRLIGEVEEYGERKGMRAEQFIDLDHLMTVAAAFIDTNGYMSAKKAAEIAGDTYGGPPTTASDIRWALFMPKGNLGGKLSDREKKLLELARAPSDAHKQKAKEVLDWFRALPDQQKQGNEFMHNVDVLVKSGKVNPRNVGYVVALFPLHARAMDQIKPRVQKSNEWLGQPGQKLPPTKVKVIRTRNIESNFGYGHSTTQIVNMEDEKGNVLTWFNNSQTKMEEGKEYTITGTIKKHDEFNGRKQTHVTRVKAA